MNLFTARCIQYASLLLMAVICTIGISLTNFVIICIGGVIGIAGAVVWIIFGRCPKCGGFLGRYASKHCPHCGENLD